MNEMERGREGGPVGRRLTTIQGRDLTGRHRRIPADLDAPAWLFIAHYQAQQPQVDAWMAAVAGTGVQALEAPVMQRRYRPAARLIEGGMAGNLTPEIRARTICLYANVDAWRAERLLSADRVVTALLLDADGTVRMLAYGSPTAASAAAIEAACRSLGT